jgi:iron complex outermembrane receptor protein
MILAARLTLIASILALIYMPLTAVPQGIQQNSNTEEAVSQSAETEGESSSGINLPEVVVEDREEADEDSFTAEDAISGTKTDTPLIEVPQSVSVITEEQIEQQAAQSVGAALRYTPGVNAEGFGFDSRYDWIYIRGFLAPKYLDGLRLPYGQGYAEPKVEPYGLERIEVLKGPSFSLYGQVPPGGLVSMISKRPTPFPLHEVLLQYGSYDRYQGAFDLGGPIDERGQLLYRFTGLLRKSDTQTDYTEDNRIFLAPALTFRPACSTTITLLSYFQKDDNKGLGNQFLPSQGTLFFNPNGKIPTSRFVGEPDFDRFDRTTYSIGYELVHEFNEIISLRQNFRFMKTEVDPENAVIGAGLEPDLRTLNRFVYNILEDIHTVEVDTQVLANLDTGPVRNEVLLGFDYLWLKDDFSFGFGTAPTIDVFAPVYGQPFTPPLPAIETSQKQNQFGLYLQDQVFFKGFVLTLTGREDWVNDTTRDFLADTSTKQDDRAFSGRAGLSYVFDFGLAPYISFAQSFQQLLGTTFEGEPFKPSKGKEFEGGIKYQPEWFPGIFTVAAYEINQKNVLTPDPDNEFFSIQTGKARVRGFELEGTASPLPGLNLTGGYSYTDAVIAGSTVPEEIGKQLPQVPKNQWSLWADYTLQQTVLRGLGLGAGVRYVGDSYPNTVNSFKIPSFTLADAALYYNFGGVTPKLGGLNLAVNAQNLFDKEYVSSCSGVDFCYYGDRRVVLATLTFNW